MAIRDFDETKLILQIWDQIENSRDIFYQRFFDQLYELEPSLRDMFESREISNDFIVSEILAYISRNAFNLQNPMNLYTLRETLKNKGVKTSHYVTFNNAFLSALQSIQDNPMTVQEVDVWERLFRRSY
jgi:hemoglobin-like flavoprotein